ncbi:ferritin family protein [Anoxynatronum sibiricum]|uniref:Ferritin family protein n=1 Tax=Anoxynatronum sibiricum TaxID=210623 RepID=A0ABU9VRU4_9CLOT
MTLQTVLDALVTSEYDAGAVYEIIASRNEGDVASTSLVFAEQERQHAQRIKSLIEHRGDLNQQVSDEVGQRLMIYLKESDSKIEAAAASRKQLFRHALKMEKDSIALYQAIAKLFELGSVGRRQFEDLVKEEQTHMYFVLKQLHDME